MRTLKSPAITGAVSALIVLAAASIVTPLPWPIWAAWAALTALGVWWAARGRR